MKGAQAHDAMCKQGIAAENASVTVHRDLQSFHLERVEIRDEVVKGLLKNWMHTVLQGFGFALTLVQALVTQPNTSINRLYHVHLDVRIRKCSVRGFVQIAYLVDYD